MGIGLQAIQLSPYHAGLAEQRCKRLLPFPALSACSCPLALSGSGEPLTQGCPLNPSHLRWGCCMNYYGAPEAERYPEVKDPAVDLIYLAAEAWAAATHWQAGPSDA